MRVSSPFLIIHKPCEEAIIWATFKLERSGYKIVRTFDMQTARLTHPDHPCPQHESTQCECQMVVLLVYQETNAHLTITIHGTEKTSWLYLANIQHQLAGLQLEKNVQDLLNAEDFEKS